MAPGALPFRRVRFISCARRTRPRIGSYQARPAGQEVLLAYFGGDLAIELEQRGELEAFARDELRQIFGVGLPRRNRAESLRRAGSRDPWSLGSYSYALAGKAHRREQLSEPLHERIFFAGEACSHGPFGTIHGAWHSGVSAAGKALARWQDVASDGTERSARCLAVAALAHCSSGFPRAA